MSYKLNYISLVYLLTLAPIGLENQYQCFESVRSQTTGSGSVLPDYRKKSLYQAKKSPIEKCMAFE